MLKRFLGFVVIGTLLLGFGWLFHLNPAQIELRVTPSKSYSLPLPLLVLGSLTVTNTVNVAVLGGNWSPGVYPLVKYTGTLVGPGFAALNLTTLPLRVAGVLSNDTVNSSIDLIVSKAA